MSPTPDDRTLDPQQLIAELQRQLAARAAELDEAQQQLIERTAERDEGEAQKAAISEVLRVINSSPGDLTPVFDAILEKAHSLCGVAFGVMLLHESGRFRAVAVRGLSGPLVEQLRQPIEVPPESPHARLLAGEQVVQIPDLSLVPLRPDSPRAQLNAQYGLRTALYIPLRKDADLLGQVVAFRQEVRAFSDKEIALLQNFAAQAVIAMENARLINETREALEQQTATAEVLQVINSSPGDLAPVFDAILEKAHSLCNSDHGTLFLRDEAHFRPAAMRGVLEPIAERLREGLGADAPVVRPLLAGEHFVHILDMAQLDHPLAGLSSKSGVHALLSVPLRKGDELFGMIVTARFEAGAFSDKQIALLRNFAAQAVIAMENARLITETREALEQQTATAEVLGVINSSPGDLAPVFEAMLEKAMALCEASSATLYTLEVDHARLAAMRGASDVPEWMRQQDVFDPPPGSSIDRLRRGERFVRLFDAKETEAYRASPSYREMIDLSGCRSSIVVGLRKEGTLLGVIAAYRQEVRPFTDKQIALLENFAAQAVIAMENGRLITETREALEQQTATAEVLGVINSSPGDLVPVFEAVLGKALRLCDAAFGHLLTFDGEQFGSAAVHGEQRLVEHLRQRGPLRTPTDAASLLGRIVVGGEHIVQSADLLETNEYHTAPPFREFVDIGGYRRLLNVALRKENVLFGVIVICRKEVRPFSDKQIALLENFAAQAVIAMENARLLGELRQRTEEVGELNRDLEARVAEQVDELGRVGRLKRFLAPQLAELIVSQGDEKILESHRREIVVVFCDLRGYTAFTETAEPEEVLDFLRQYHGALGPLVSQFEGTLDQFSGDGIMVFFNDPIPCPDPAERAVKMAIAMREVAGTLIAAWRRRGRMLGFGAGIAQGYATLGQIGFADRSGYTAIGTVCNLAARLCAEAKDGQILIAQLVAVAVEETTPLEEVGELTLKGLTQPVVAYNVPLQAAQPALRVIEGGGPQTV